MLVELIQIARLELQRHRPTNDDGHSEPFASDETPCILTAANENRIDAMTSARSAADREVHNEGCTSPTHRESFENKLLTSPRPSISSTSVPASYDEGILVGCGLPPRIGNLSGHISSTSQHQNLMPLSKKQNPDSGSEGGGAGTRAIHQGLEVEQDLAEIGLAVAWRVSPPWPAQSVSPKQPRPGA